MANKPRFSERQRAGALALLVSAMAMPLSGCSDGDDGGERAKCAKAETCKPGKKQPILY